MREGEMRYIGEGQWGERCERKGEGRYGRTRDVEEKQSPNSYYIYVLFFLFKFNVEFISFGLNQPKN